MGAGKRYNESMPTKLAAVNSTWDGNSLQQYANVDLNETEMYNTNNISNSNNGNNQFGATQQRLFDLMARSGLPTNYYELFSSNNTGDFLQQGAEQSSSSNVTNNNHSSKGIFERAGNLIQEMKHLEQKKAAALLAAFRYQVPGPLVRPWDVSSDFHHQFGLHPPSSISRFFSDRLDETSNKQLPTSQLINTIKSTLFKQKFIARDELLARLNANKAIIN